MILTQLVLRDFCLYRGEQSFDLSPGSNRGQNLPIVLLGGINGGGKTTFLDAVQLVLYGPRAKCSKRADKAYDRFLRESIHHGVDKSHGASIRLGFRYAAHGQEHLYEVTRSWSEVRGRIREKVQVCRDGDPDSWLARNWSQVVEELIPFGIAELCFFDAEKVRFLAEDETSTQALGEAIKSLLGLDLVEQLVTDAAVLERRVARRADKSADLEELEGLERELELKNNQIAEAVQDDAGLENERQAAKKRLAAVEADFAEAGGHHWKEREKHRRDYADRERDVREASQELVLLASGEMPLSLVPGLLARVAAQAERERRDAEARIISRLLETRDRQLIRRLKRKRVDGETVALIATLLEEDRAPRHPGGDEEARLRLSDTGRRQLENLLDGALERCQVAAKALVEAIENGRRELEDLHRAMAATPKEDAIREIAEEFKRAAKELASVEQKKARVERTLDTLRAEKQELEKRLGKLQRKVVDEQIHAEEDARIAKLLIHTQETMSRFLHRVTARKIERLSRLISESFRYLLRKATLVQRVVIDPKTFDISLFDEAGRDVERRRLSEGEKQVFAVSVLWGLSRASPRPLPAIIDTPMARLDAKHRQKLVERYFPHASHQVVILSTDTEIERKYFDDLHPYIARAYHLNYDEKQKVTVAEKGYFWEAQRTGAVIA